MESYSRILAFRESTFISGINQYPFRTSGTLGHAVRQVGVIIIIVPVIKRREPLACP
jgi:hypothetical protein